MGIWRCNFNPRYTSPSCAEMLAVIWSYCWNKGFISQLSRTRCHFLLQSENSLVLGGVIICVRCLVPPATWVSYQGYSATESSGTSWRLIFKSVFVKLIHSKYKEFPHLSPCVGERGQFNCIFWVLGVGEFLESWFMWVVVSDGIRPKQSLSNTKRLFLAQEIVKV